MVRKARAQAHEKARRRDAGQKSMRERKRVKRCAGVALNIQVSASV